MRQSVTFTREQFAYLLGRAERLSISVSELVRRIIDEHRERKESK